MANKEQLFESLRKYLMSHPEEVLRVLKNLFFLRVGVPLDALRWAAGRAGGKKGPKDVQIEAVPPGVRVGATINLMGAIVRASAVIYIEDIRLNSQELRIEIRLGDVAMKVLEDNDSAVAALLRSGALDLSKPGNLAAYMPKRPAMLVEAKDDRLVLDLMKHPALRNERVERLIGLITPFITIGAIRTDWEHLDVDLQPFQEGVAGAVAAVRERLDPAAFTRPAREG